MVEVFEMKSDGRCFGRKTNDNKQNTKHFPLETSENLCVHSQVLVEVFQAFVTTILHVNFFSAGWYYIFGLHCVASDRSQYSS